MHTTLDTQPARPAAPVADHARPNLYLPIHKALRSFMMDTLFRIGQIDAADEGDKAAALSQLDSLLSFCAEHVEHENRFLHTAIEACEPGAAERTAGDHEEHIDSIDALRDEANALRRATDAAEQALLALRLYRHVALFVADNFQHMHIEETANAATLFRHYSDAQLAEIHERLLATISPSGHLLTARWMMPAMNPAERAAAVNGMKMQMPPEALLGVLEHVRPHLDAPAWERLQQVARAPRSVAPAGKAQPGGSA